MSTTIKQLITDTQKNLILLGMDLGPKGADGIWGNLTETAYQKIYTGNIRKDGWIYKVPWGKKFTNSDIATVAKLCERLVGKKSFAQDLMSCMAFETGETLSPSQSGPDGSSATGLIQFMNSTAKSLGTTTDALAKMTVSQQLVYVEKYFNQWKGRIKNMGDLYMAILWPIAIGADDADVLWSKVGKYSQQYAANSGLDINGDGVVRRSEAVMRIREKLVKGLLPKYASSVEI